jgi:hypothetical protein
MASHPSVAFGKALISLRSDIGALAQRHALPLYLIEGYAQGCGHPDLNRLMQPALADVQAWWPVMSALSAASSGEPISPGGASPLFSSASNWERRR